jgi:hypothetical protein
MAIRRIGRVKGLYLLPATLGIASYIATRCGIVEHRTRQIAPGCRSFRVMPAGLSRSDFGPFSITAYPVIFSTNAALGSENSSANIRVGRMDKETRSGIGFIPFGVPRRLFRGRRFPICLAEPAHDAIEVRKLAHK